MKPSTPSTLWLLWKLIVLSLFLSPFFGKSWALDELLRDYDSPQGLAMGNAYTSDARGHSANYYNPAGLAKEYKRTWEVIPFAFDGIMGMGSIGSAVGTRSLGAKRLLGDLQQNPGDYAYQRFNLSAAISRRNMALTFLGSYWLAARSDGTNVDADTGYDVGPALGWGINLAGNTLKLGVSLRAFIRNQLKDTVPHTSLSSDAVLRAFMKEGLGFGLNVGMMVTLPMSYLPTLSIVCKDALDTYFSPTNYFNSASTSAPDPVFRSFNVGFSMHPYFSRGLKAIVALEVKNLELIDLDWRKRVHLGIQLETERALYFWLGLNQLYPTGGIGWRVPGGDLELGTYAQDVGTGNTREQNRRLFMRYTIDF